VAGQSAVLPPTAPGSFATGSGSRRPAVCASGVGDREDMSANPSTTSSDELAALVKLVVHDLRNPAATVAANVAYMKDVGPGGADDVDEALEDVEAALGQLMVGLEQLAWMGQWLGGQPPLEPGEGDVALALEGFRGSRGAFHIEVDVAERPLPARGGNVLPKILEVLFLNASQHARRGTIHVGARRLGGEVLVEVRDEGPAIDPEDRAQAFTLAGQQVLKTKANGRYGRVAALFALRVAIEGLGGRIEADGDDGHALFRIALPAV